LKNGDFCENKIKPHNPVRRRLGLVERWAA
jgi:hypothetical protein